MLVRCLSVLLVVVSGGGCLVDVDYGAGSFRCASSGMCPEGLVCDSQRCVAPGAADAAADAVSSSCGDQRCTETCASCAEDCGACIDGTLIHWPFDEAGGTSIIDASGAGRVAALTGGARIDSPRGGALELDGTSANVLRAGDVDLAVGEVALSAWVRVEENLLQDREVVSFGDLYGLRVNDTGVINFFVRQTDDWQGVQSIERVDDGQWHHVLGQLDEQADGFVFEVYVDGAFSASEPLTEGINYAAIASRDLLVGQHGNGETIYAFAGAIDEVRVIARPLDAAEIAALAAD